MQHNNTKIINLTHHNMSRYNFSDEIVGQHHRLNGHEYEQTPGDSDGHEIAWHDAVHRVAKSQT